MSLDFAYIWSPDDPPPEEENSTADKRARRERLARAGKMKCSRCPPHGGENAGRRPRPDHYKSKRRR